MSNFKMHIPPDKVEQTRKFFCERGGCVLWKNQEIGNPRLDIMTPATHEDGSPATKPHWAYGDPTPLKVEEIGVRKEMRILLPDEWFPECSYCNATGRRPIQDIADARKCSVEEAKQQLRTESSIDRGVKDEDNTLDCWQCNGTGHTDQYVRANIKAMYWGPDITDTGKARANRWLARLKLHTGNFNIQWSWEFCDYKKAEIIFFTEEITSFTLE